MNPTESRQSTEYSLFFARQWLSDKVLHRPVETAANSGQSIPKKTDLVTGGKRPGVDIVRSSLGFRRRSPDMN